MLGVDFAICSIYRDASRNGVSNRQDRESLGIIQNLANALVEEGLFLVDGIWWG